MNLTWHLVSKDLRRFRAALLGWSALVALELLIGVTILAGFAVRDGTFEILSRAVLALLVGQSVLIVALTVFIVQSDAPSAEESFWRARPISGGRLLRSKLLTLGLAFVGCPVLLHLPWWLWCRLDSAQMAWAALDLAVRCGGLAALALAGASLTRTPLQLIFASLAAVVSLFVLGGFIESGFDHRAEVLSRWVVAIAVVIAGGTLAGLAAYLSRRRWIARACAVGTIGVLAANSHWGPKAGQADRLRETYLANSEGSTPPSLPAGSELELVSAEVTQRAGKESLIKLHLRLRGMPARTVVLGGKLTIRFRAPGGGVDVAKNDWVSPRFMTVWSAGRFFFGEVPGGREKDDLQAGVWLPAEVLARLEKEADAEFSLELHLAEFREREVIPGKLQTSRGTLWGYGFYPAGDQGGFRQLKYLPLSASRVALLGPPEPAEWPKVRVVTKDGNTRWRIHSHSENIAYVGGVGIEQGPAIAYGVSVKDRKAFGPADLDDSAQLTISEVVGLGRVVMTKRVDRFPPPSSKRPD